MRTLILRNTIDTLRVEYKVDIKNDSDENFTIMEIIGLDSDEITIAGLIFQRIQQSFGAFKTFAKDNNLILEVIKDLSTATEELVAETTAYNITTTSLPGGNDTVPYSETLISEGGNGKTTWTVTIGSLPSGLTLDSATGVISGTPDTVENPNFTVEATDAFGQKDTQALSINIAA